ETKFAEGNLTTTTVERFINDFLDEYLCQKHVIIYEKTGHFTVLQKSFKCKPTLYYKRSKYDTATAALAEAKMYAGHIPNMSLALCYDGTCDNLPDCDLLGSCTRIVKLMQVPKQLYRKSTILNMQTVNLIFLFPIECIFSKALKSAI